MKRTFILLVICLLSLGIGSLQAQNKPSGKTTANSKNKPEPKPETPLVELPAKSTDCLFAIPLQLEIPYGPTTAPQGAGRILEISRDKNNPNVFEYEHNSVWYKFTVPYNGNLEIAISPNSPTDDYDFLVYRYTDEYFSNRLIENRIKPIAGNIGGIDSVAVAQAYPQQKPKTATSATTSSTQRPASSNPKSSANSQPRFRGPLNPTLGMSVKGTKLFIGPNSTEGFVKSIPVKKGEVYYIVLDNKTPNGTGHTIKVSLQVDAYTPTLIFYDPVAKKNVDVDLLVLEKNTDNRPIAKNPMFKGGKLKLVPGFSYTLYAKKEGYFSIYKEFNSNIFKEDTLMRFIMNKATAGTVFAISDIYFNDDAQLLPESDTALLNYIAMFRNHPGVSFTIKGYVQSYGVDMDNDLKISLARAESVKKFFVEHGLQADRIKVAGMTQNEIKRSAAAALNKTQSFKEAKVELIITEYK